jgi:hypothetical protein
MAITLSTFIPRLAPMAPDASDFLLGRALLTAFTRLCKAGQVWRENYVVDAVEDVTDYVVGIPTGTIIQSVMRARYGGDRDMVSGDASVRYSLTGKEGTPVVATIVGTATLSIAPAPVILSDTLEVLLILAPSVSTTYSTVVIPEHILERYGDTLEAGALAYLLRQPGKGYTDIRAANDYEVQFREAIAMAADNADQAQNQVWISSYGGL